MIQKIVECQSFGIGKLSKFSKNKRMLKFQEIFVMNDQKRRMPIKTIDTKEFELPDTHFVRDVENNVFQGIVLQCLSKVEGIGLIEGNFIDNIFNRSSLEHVKGIHVEQDNKNHSVVLK